MAIDFYGNYITNSHDNPIEADGGMHNIRIMNNIINHSPAFCNQPALEGLSTGSGTSPITYPAVQPVSQRARGCGVLQQRFFRNVRRRRLERPLEKQPVLG